MSCTSNPTKVQCTYSGCSNTKGFKSMKGLHRHITKSHACKEFECVGCNETFKTAKTRNQHHKICSSFQQRLEEGDTSKQPTNASSKQEAIAEQNLMSKLVTELTKTGASVVINNTYNNTSNNNCNNNINNTQNNSITFNLQPVYDRDIDRCFTKLAAECKETNKLLDNQTTGNMLASSFANSFICTDRSRHTNRWFDGEKNKIIVDQACVEFEKKFHRNTHNGIQIIKSQLAQNELPREKLAQWNLYMSPNEYLEYQNFKSFVSRLEQKNNNYQPDSKFKGSIRYYVSNNTAKTNYKSIHSPEQTQDCNLAGSFQKFVAVMKAKIESTLAYEASIVLQSPEYLGCVLDLAIQQYIKENQLQPVEYDFVDDFNDCTIILQDDNKTTVTMIAPNFFYIVASYLCTLSTRIEDIKNVKLCFKPYLPSYIIEPELNHQRMLQFMTNPAVTTSYQQSMYAVMASSVTSD